MCKDNWVPFHEIQKLMHGKGCDIVDALKQWGLVWQHCLTELDLHLASSTWQRLPGVTLPLPRRRQKREAMFYHTTQRTLCWVPTNAWPCMKHWSLGQNTWSQLTPQWANPPVHTWRLFRFCQGSYAVGLLRVTIATFLFFWLLLAVTLQKKISCFHTLWGVKVSNIGNI